MRSNSDDQGTGMQGSSFTTLLFRGRVDAGTSYKTGPRSGYARCKNVVIFIKVVGAHATPPSLAFSLYHGPDAANLALYGTVIAAATATGVLAGSTDADTNGQFGDILEGSITVTGSNWASIEVYEVRKPF